MTGGPGICKPPGPRPLLWIRSALATGRFFLLEGGPGRLGLCVGLCGLLVSLLGLVAELVALSLQGVDQAREVR